MKAVQKHKFKIQENFFHATFAHLTSPDTVIHPWVPKDELKTVFSVCIINSLQSGISAVFT